MSSMWLDKNKNLLKELASFEATVHEEESHIEQLCKHRLELARKEVKFWEDAYREAKIARSTP